MMRLTFAPAGMHHVAPIAARMRAADVAEVRAISGRSPHDALMFSLRRSAVAWTALFDGRPEVMFGIGDLNILARVGSPWLLGTDVVETEYRQFLRASRNWSEQLFADYDLLRNFVDDRNEVSKRWLKWLGFTLMEPMPIGRDGEMFRLFELRR